MPFRDITDPDAVLKAIGLYDEMGREAFSEEFGYGKAREYFLLHDGKHYDSKAIIGVAHQFQFPDRGPLKNTDFSGGEITVQRKLQELGSASSGLLNQR